MRGREGRGGGHFNIKHHIEANNDCYVHQAHSLEVWWGGSITRTVELNVWGSQLEYSDFLQMMSKLLLCVCVLIYCDDLVLKKQLTTYCEVT